MGFASSTEYGLFGPQDLRNFEGEKECFESCFI